MKQHYYPLLLLLFSFISCLPSDLERFDDDDQVLELSKDTQLSLKGDYHVGKTLRISGLPNTPNGYGREIFWYRNGEAIDRANDQTSYTLRKTDVGKRVKVTAQYYKYRRDDHDHHENRKHTYTFESSYGPYVTSDPTEEVADKNNVPILSEKPVILGHPYIGETLRIRKFRNDPPKGYRVEYTWQRDEVDFLKTYQRKYTLSRSDLGKKISVKARYVRFPNYITYKYPIGNPRTDGQVKHNYERYGVAYNVLFYQFLLDSVQAKEFDIDYKISIKQAGQVLHDFTTRRTKGQGDGYYISRIPAFVGFKHTNYSHWSNFRKNVRYSWQVELTIDGETTTSPAATFKRVD